MCELFAMSARYPATVSMSMEEFSRHGGLSGPHKDGWGVAWFDHGDVQLIREPSPAADSRCVSFLKSHPFTTSIALSHIRKATVGELALRNCQPFIRELGGRWHVFAHNGHLPGIAVASGQQSGRFQPVGETDSELAFCALLERLVPLWSDRGVPDLQRRRRIVEAFADELRVLGPANFLYSDGDALFAHADRRHQADGEIRPPGLWWLSRHCPSGGEFSVAGLTVEGRSDEQEVTLVASVPLSDEEWKPLPRGSLLVATAGKPLTPGNEGPAVARRGSSP
jgi:glutamine amidotransferase